AVLFGSKGERFECRFEVEQRTKIFLAGSRKPLKTVKDETCSNDGQRLSLCPFCASVESYAHCRAYQNGKRSKASRKGAFNEFDSGDYRLASGVQNRSV